jgi:hypothetical protein
MFFQKLNTFLFFWKTVVQNFGLLVMKLRCNHEIFLISNFVVFNKKRIQQNDVIFSNLVM